MFGYGKATLANLTPGPVRPQGALQTPATNPDPVFNYTVPSYYSAPVADPAVSGGSGAAPAVQVNRLEVDESISRAGSATLSPGCGYWNKIISPLLMTERRFSKPGKGIISQGLQIRYTGEYKTGGKCPGNPGSLHQRGGAGYFLECHYTLPDDPPTSPAKPVICRCFSGYFWQVYQPSYRVRKRFSR